MPRGDGTGPPAGGGRRMGRGVDRGERGERKVGGRKPLVGREENCVCPNCGTVTPHPVAGACYNLSCPGCGAKMVRG